MTDELTDTYIDRSRWASGPWDNEPDRVEWRDEATGLPCLLRRGNPHIGAWCGYVAMPPGHPWHGAEYDDIDVRVHGGLTFSGPCDEGDGTDRICHVPLPGESDNVWWLGFDCGHGMDLKPGMAAFEAEMEQTYGPQLIRAMSTLRGEVYRDLDYARRQCELIAQQAVHATRVNLDKR
jgi:hypothetical protein